MKTPVSLNHIIQTSNVEGITSQQHTATHCSTHYNSTLQQHTATAHCNSALQQHTATAHCNSTLQQHTATEHGNARALIHTIQTSIVEGITPQQHTATHCSTHCNTLQQNMETRVPLLHIMKTSIVEGITLQQHTTTIHAATVHCNTL